VCVRVCVCMCVCVYEAVVRVSNSDGSVIYNMCLILWFANVVRLAHVLHMHV